MAYRRIGLALARDVKYGQRFLPAILVCFCSVFTSLHVM